MKIIYTVYGLCVELIDWVDDKTGLTWPVSNVLFFCVIEPAVCLFLLWIIFRLRKQLSEALKIQQKFNEMLSTHPNSYLDEHPDNPTVLVTVETRGGRTAPLGSRGYEIQSEGRSILCKTCGLKSFHPKDVEHLYCSCCHVFHIDTAALETHK